ncbi:hypothetical protein [Bradyrhizobium sp. SEMIA]|uniref:hypothetical protein n=1 Tax=Bradyrhizobium sp. SEMIA TaxID=2597515 RepID=UPI0018A4928D|nr:hypothetical protein [Bradyrhizobium sp. SEMIA]QOG20454.1 hypothetical protein FOM02_26975 [Bradyrhizobium sp. SEMIA]
MRDFLHSVVAKRAISSTRVTDNTAQVSQIIDMQGFEAAMFVINTGTLADADATFAVLLEEGDQANLSDNGAVAAKDMISMSSAAAMTAAGFQFDSDNQVRTIGYIGGKRYIRLTITPANNTGNADIGAICLQSRAGLRPTVQGTS